MRRLVREEPPTRVIATAREAWREAIQRKQRGLIKRIKAWISAPSATARNDGGINDFVHNQSSKDAEALRLEDCKTGGLASLAPTLQ